MIFVYIISNILQNMVSHSEESGMVMPLLLHIMEGSIGGGQEQIGHILILILRLAAFKHPFTVGC